MQNLTFRKTRKLAHCLMFSTWGVRDLRSVYFDDYFVFLLYPYLFPQLKYGEHWRVCLFIKLLLYSSFLSENKMTKFPLFSQSNNTATPLREDRPHIYVFHQHTLEKVRSNAKSRTLGSN